MKLGIILVIVAFVLWSIMLALTAACIGYQMGVEDALQALGGTE